MAAFGEERGMIDAEIPQELVELTRKVVRAFYSPIDVVIMDLLLNERCVKDSDIVAMIGVHQRHIQGELSKLLKDQFIKKISRYDPTEEVVEGETQMKHDYYFINYETLVNVVRLRIYMMTRATNTETTQKAIKQTTMSCGTCGQEFTDLDMARIMDIMTGLMKCVICEGEVVYHDRDTTVSARDKNTANIATFNKQLNPITELLKNCEPIVIKLAVLEPPPSTKRYTSDSRNVKKPRLLQSAPGANEFKQETVIDFGDEGNTIISKAAPSFHSQSLFSISNGQEPAFSKPVVPKAEPIFEPDKPDDAAIRDALEQAKSNVVNAAEPVTVVPDDDDDNDDETIVMVGGKNVAFEDITDEHISAMTAEEKEKYEELKEILE